MLPLAAAALLLAGATWPNANAAPAAPAPEAAAAPRPAAPVSALPAFAVLVKDARRIAGPLPLWQKDDKVWIEIAPDTWGKPFLFSPKIASGIAEAGVLGGLMAYPVSGAGGAQLVEFVRLHQQVRLQSRNTLPSATPGSPEARAAAASFAPSLLASAPVASQPQPQTGAVLVEANALFLGDLLGVGMSLQRAFRQPYALDARNTAITAVRASADVTVIETSNHYYAANLAPAAPGGPSLPRFVPDARSLIVGHHYSLAPLPAEPMTPRRADARVGFFTTRALDFSGELGVSPRQRWVNRWRLEKRDPAAALSEPVKPITFWIDRNVPLAWRGTVRDAILEWNQAFERIGFHDAIVVRQQADDADFDTLDAGRASVRWMTSPEPAFAAIGPSQVDPRSGEILDADIGFEAIVTRLKRAERTQVLAGVAGAAAAPGADAGTHADCSFGELAAEQLAYALDVLAARDDLAADDPRTRNYVQDYVKDTVMHEVGHALGLRHNFRASRAYTEAQLADPEFTRVHGTTGSVMEYNAINLPRPGEPLAAPFQTTLGPYDYWAIEYAYKPIAAADEAAELQRIAGRGSEPLLAFGTDEDNSLGLDPEVAQLDLGADPIVFAAKRLAIARELLLRQETRRLDPDEDFSVLRRSIVFALGDVGRATQLLLRQIGGVRTLRDHPGSGRDPLQPLPAATQRQALALLMREVLGAEGLTLSPALQRRLAPDYLDRGDYGTPTDFALPQRLLELQRGVLATLMSDAFAGRVLDAAAKVDRPQDAFGLPELQAQLLQQVWSELAAGKPITAPRRELQREHASRLAAALLQPPSRADARALQRSQAQTLLARLDQALAHPAKRDAQTRAHLQDSAQTLRQALRARLARAGV
ncbi:zinc-dependent metalloprotease [Rubrivivax gelatinosus]|uniref:zinc-dependent metalloprotease n=1 Tax=Rubrivivax gelatinosus TaxID=28068 RepID=UPI0031FA14CD